MKILLGIIVISVISGCSSGASVDENGVVSDAGSNASVTLITLKDGTKCAVLVGANKGALSCDWRK